MGRGSGVFSRYCLAAAAWGALLHQVAGAVAGGLEAPQVRAEPLGGVEQEVCGGHGSCTSCLQASYFGLRCKWCPVDEHCHTNHGFASPCGPDEDITNTSQCPAPAPPKTGFTLTDALEMAKYSYAAYFDDPARSKMPASAAVVQTFNFSLGIWNDAFAYMAVDSSAKRIVLAFRGTVTLTQAATEILQHFLVPLPNHTEVLVNAFFLRATLDLKEDIDKVLKNIWNSTCQDCQLWVTGHSLGGALAMLSAARVADRNAGLGHVPVVYTFGQPRVGNAALAELVADLVPSHYRVVNAADAVPHVPFCSTGTVLSAAPCLPTRSGYYHSGTEIWFPLGEYENGTMCGYRECVGNPAHEDWSCSDGLISDLYPGSLFDHHRYWDVIDHGYCQPRSQEVLLV